MSARALAAGPKLSPYVLAVRALRENKRVKSLARLKLGELDIEIRAAPDSIWVFVRREGKGGLAIRAAYLTSEPVCEMAPAKAGEAARLNVKSVLGAHTIVLRTGGGALENFRATTTFKPAVSMAMPFMPRDLYPLDAWDDPLAPKGVVEATQKGLNAGIVYFRIEAPAFGNVLYFQNLTAMNGYYRATKTTPDGVVGGEWPELGYLPPAPKQAEEAPMPTLAAGVDVTLSDAILVFRHDAPAHERESARQFLQMLGVAYSMLEAPETEYRDWIKRAEHTLRDLDEAPEATIRHYGHRYVHPYTAAEYPDRRGSARLGQVARRAPSAGS